MADVHRDAAFARDGDRFVDRGGKAHGVVCLVAQVAIVGAAHRARDLRQRDDFVGPGKALRGVEEPGREPQRAFAHRAADQRLLFGEFGGSGRAARLADDLRADRPEPGKRAVIDPDRLGRGAGKQLAHGDRSAAIVADERGGHALEEERLHQSLARVVRGERLAHVRMRIDEPGGHDHARRLDRARGAHRQPRADRDDPVAADRDVAGERRSAARIDRAAADEQVDLGWRDPGVAQLARARPSARAAAAAVCFIPRTPLRAGA